MSVEQLLDIRFRKLTIRCLRVPGFSCSFLARSLDQLKARKILCTPDTRSLVLPPRRRAFNFIREPLSDSALSLESGISDLLLYKRWKYGCWVGQSHLRAFRLDLQSYPSMKFSLAYILAALCATAAGQSVTIAFPEDGATVSAGSDITVEIDRPVG